MTSLLHQLLLTDFSTSHSNRRILVGCYSCCSSLFLLNSDASKRSNIRSSIASYKASMWLSVSRLITRILHPFCPFGLNLLTEHQFVAL